MNIIAIIPVRMDSKRFPGKPLADINGKPLVQHTYESVRRSGIDTYIATPDKEIWKVAKSFGAKCVITSKDCRNGTIRCAEAFAKIESVLYREFGTCIDAVINVQGDQPNVPDEHLTHIQYQIKEKECQIATLMVFDNSISAKGDTNVVKVILDIDQNAVLFGRRLWSEWRHIGIYAYRANVLTEIADLLPTSGETAENLEQMCWIDHGYKIGIIETSKKSTAIDTPEQLKEYAKNQNKQTQGGCSNL